MVKTDHILFIASGAFHFAKPSDLIPELQGRFPIRVELDSLSVDDFERILTEHRRLPGQAVRGAARDRGRDARVPAGRRSGASPRSPSQVNEKTENIGARRLYTVMEKLLEDVSFDAGKRGAGERDDRRRVRRHRLKNLAASEDLARYVL